MKILAQANQYSLDQLGTTGRVALAGIGGFLAADPAMERINKVRGIDHTPLGITGKLVGAGVAIAAIELTLRKGGGVDIDIAKKHLLRDAAEYAAAVKAMPDGEAKTAELAGLQASFGRSPDEVIALAVAAKVRKAA